MQQQVQNASMAIGRNIPGELFSNAVQAADQWPGFRRSSGSIEKMTGRTMFEKGKRIRAAVLAMLLHNKVKEAKRGHVCPSTKTEDWNRMGR